MRESVDSDAGQEQGHHFGATTGPRHRIDQKRCSESSQESEQSDTATSGGNAKHDCGGGTQGSTCRNTYDTRLGKGVTKDRLHEGSGNSKRGSHC